MIWRALLNKFCSRDPIVADRIGKPWSSGDFTFATNTHVMIRVDRLHDVPENPYCPSADVCAEVMQETAPEAGWQEIRPHGLSKTMCIYCSGRGYILEKFDCPHCGCGIEKEDGEQRECRQCDGSGYWYDRLVILPEISAHKMFDAFDPKYIDLLLEIPGQVMIRINGNRKATSFTFDGGCGVIMPINYPGYNPETGKRIIDDRK